MSHDPLMGPRLHARTVSRRLLLGALAAVILAPATGCDEETTAPSARARGTAAAAYSTAPLPTTSGSEQESGAVPRGIGGSHTITAGGERIIAVPMTATGIMVPDGVPVRVQVSGAITRTPTPGLQEFCALPRWKSACESSWASIVSGAPIGPSGFASAVPKVALNGGSSTSSPSSGSTVAMETSSGGEVWFGRGGWGCYYVDGEHNLSGACHNFGGGWTVTVSANDGRPPRDPADTTGADDGDGDEDDEGGSGGRPALYAKLTSSTPTADGANATLEAVARNGTASSVRWLFVPDVVGSTNGDTTASAEPTTSGRIVEGERDASSGTERITRIARDRWRLPGGRVVGAGLHLVQHEPPQATGTVQRRPAVTQQAGGAIASMTTTSSAAVALGACAESLDCEATVNAKAGTFVVVAQVGNELLSAEARLTSVAPRATAVLTCPGSVVRGSEAVCEVKVMPEEARATATLQVASWSFTPSDAGNPPIGRIERQTDTEAHSWGGTMAVGGTVDVRGTVNGAPFELSAVIVVTGRSWGTKTVDVEVVNVGQGDLPARPTALEGQLGSNLPDIKWNLQAQTGISGGPNDGVSYYKDMPVGLKFTVSANVVALAEGSDFWSIQPRTTREIGGRKICGQNTVARILQLVYKHEGLSRTDRNSHTQIFADRFEKEMRKHAAVVEQMVGAGDVGGLIPLAEQWYGLALADSQAMDTAGYNVITNVSMGCDDFNYRYPAGGSK